MASADDAMGVACVLSRVSGRGVETNDRGKDMALVKNKNKKTMLLLVVSKNDDTAKQ